jgi:hypothetical protein
MSDFVRNLHAVSVSVDGIPGSLLSESGSVCGDAGRYVSPQVEPRWNGDPFPLAGVPPVHFDVVSETLSLGQMLAWDTVHSGAFHHTSLLIRMHGGTFMLHDIVTETTSSGAYRVVFNEAQQVPRSRAGRIYDGLRVKVAQTTASRMVPNAGTPSIPHSSSGR